MKNKKVIFAILIIIAIAIRIYNYPNVISEMNCDEIMTVVNAKSIADSGVDINGISYPVYLLGWGGQSVVLLYLMVLAIKIFGYTLFAVRLPMLIITIITLFVFYDFVKKLTKNETIGLIGLGILAISPWNILQSIWGLDCNMFPHFLLIAMDIFYTGISNKKNYLIYISMIFYAITLYCYGVAIYFVPLFLLISAIYLVKTKQVNIKTIVISIIIFLAISAPIITMFAINVLGINTNIKIFSITIPYYESLTRTKDMIFFSENPILQFFKNIIKTVKVVIFQADGLEWNASKAFGTIFRISHIFWIFALVQIIKKIKNKECNNSIFIIITWLAMSLLTGIIVNDVNINRLNTIWFVLMILTAIGIYSIYEKIKHKNIYKYTVITIYAILGISFVIYLNVSYGDTIGNSICFSKGFYNALGFARDSEKTIVYYDNVANDGCVEMYSMFNNDENKEYICIANQEELEDKLENLQENEIIILNIKDKEYESQLNFYKNGDYIVYYIKSR